MVTKDDNWRSKEILKTPLTQPLSISWLLIRCSLRNRWTISLHESECFAITFQTCFSYVISTVWYMNNPQTKTSCYLCSSTRILGIRTRQNNRQVMRHESEWPQLGLLKLSNAHSSYQKQVRQCRQTCQKKAPFIIENHEVEKKVLF